MKLTKATTTIKGSTYPSFQIDNTEIHVVKIYPTAWYLYNTRTDNHYAEARSFRTRRDALTYYSEAPTAKYRFQYIQNNKVIVSQAYSTPDAMYEASQPINGYITYQVTMLDGTWDTLETADMLDLHQAGFISGPLRTNDPVAETVEHVTVTQHTEEPDDINITDYTVRDYIPMWDDEGNELKLTCLKSSIYAVPYNGTRTSRFFKLFTTAGRYIATIIRSAVTRRFRSFSRA
jgi:hypothetical protein